MPEPQLKLTRTYSGQVWVLGLDVTTKPRGDQTRLIGFERVTLAEGTRVQCLAVERSGKRRAIHCCLEVGGLNVYVEGDPRAILLKRPKSEVAAEREASAKRSAEAAVAAAAAVERWRSQLENRWFEIKFPLRLPRRLSDGSERMVDHPPGTLAYVTRATMRWHLESNLDLKVDARITTFELAEFLLTVDGIDPRKYLLQTNREGVRRLVTRDVTYPTCQRSPSWIHHRSAKRIQSLVAARVAPLGVSRWARQIGQADPLA